MKRISGKLDATCGAFTTLYIYMYIDIYIYRDLVSVICLVRLMLQLFVANYNERTLRIFVICAITGKKAGDLSMNIQLTKNRPSYSKGSSTMR